jgi:U3 small nucleolar RNA-associated protein 21
LTNTKFSNVTNLKKLPKLLRRRPFSFLPSEIRGILLQSQAAILQMNWRPSEHLLVDADGDYTTFLNHFKTLPPSSADLEIRSLQPEELVPFVDSLTQRLRSKRDYELVQTWINVFLKCHSESIVNDVGAENGERGLRAALGEWSIEQKKEASRLAELVGYCAGVGEFLRSGR